MKSKKRRILFGIIGLIIIAIVADRIFDSGPPEKSHTEIGRAEYLVSTIHENAANGPDGLALGSDGSLYIAEFGEFSLIKTIFRQPLGTTLYKISPSGEKTIVTDQLHEPVGIAVDSQDNVIVGNDWASDILIVSPDGTISEPIASGKFSGSIQVDEDDNFYLLEKQGGEVRLVKMTRDGTVTELAKNSEIESSQAVGRDENGTIFVGDDDNILSITEDGTVTVVGTIPNAYQNFISFGDLVVVDDKIYLTGFGMEVIYVMEMDGTGYAIAGNSEHASVDGAGDKASFMEPNRMVYREETNSLLVADYTSGSIREIQLP